MLRVRLPRIPARPLHVSAIRYDLVGPPDPVSHLRPVIYDDAPTIPLSRTHPYSLNEFTGDAREYQWKLQRQELDTYNQVFWVDSNSRFEAAKAAVLASLPASASVEEREFALSEFYRHWVAQETAHQKEYSTEWRKRNWTSILLGARVQYEKLRAHLLSPLTSHTNDGKKE